MDPNMLGVAMNRTPFGRARKQKMSSRHLPPVRNLPHWTRVGFLDKPCRSRPLPAAAEAKHLQPLIPAGEVVVGGGGGGGGERERRSSPRDMVAAADIHRVASLQRNIAFLQQQHKDTLQQLHAEIDDLRRGNKDLQYKLIMDPPKLSRKAVAHPSQRGVRPPTQGGDASRGFYLEQPLQDSHCSSQDQHHAPSSADCHETPGARPADRGPELRGGLITSLQPLRIHSNPVHPPRAPTLPECEVIIRQLYNANSLQSQEVRDQVRLKLANHGINTTRILRIKAVLRDIVFNKKISPENYILTKAFLADVPRKTSAAERFPQLAHKQLPKKTPRPALARVSDGVILPALNQRLSSTIAERQKRTQAAQRSRLKRTVQ
ncbi:Coiled-coil domain-containing protein 74A [Merluccius polli]|uniref:Coiled-coil domain-containing protein 74A n=1 Tax=Merluccius polli TaxID=89951 RepID=A0AA47N7S2_MERPO|nr:Coiled-coil domain-containing protein 74A [Merluccius polli]